MDAVLPLHLASVTFPSFHPLSGQQGEVFGFAIPRPRGVVLFDTGIGAGSAFIDRHYQPIRHALEDALAVHDLALGDVTAVVNSHLHFDHCGNNPLFPGVPIYAQEHEAAATTEEMYTVVEWVSFEGATYTAIDGDLELERGLRILATPGHTTGHQSLVIETRDAPIVLAGQAIYARDELDHIAATGALLEDDPPPDAGRYLASAQRLLALRPRRMHFSHDHEVWHRPD